VKSNHIISYTQTPFVCAGRRTTDATQSEIDISPFLKTQKPSSSLVFLSAETTCTADDLHSCSTQPADVHEGIPLLSKI
jgi:hypothetical protein